MPVARRLVWSDDARDDLSDIFAYLDAHASLAVADRRLRDIGAAAARLAEWPLTGRPRHDLRGELRSWAVPPHVLFYRVSDLTIEIVRVIDGRRDLDVVFNPV
jgi:toxin ParE1/3/4